VCVCVWLWLFVFVFVCVCGVWVWGVCVCLIVCDLPTSTMRRPRPDLGCCSTEKKKIFSPSKMFRYRSQTRAANGTARNPWATSPFPNQYLLAKFIQVS